MTNTVYTRVVPGIYVPNMCYLDNVVIRFIKCSININKPVQYKKDRVRERILHYFFNVFRKLHFQKNFAISKVNG